MTESVVYSTKEPNLLKVDLEKSDSGMEEESFSHETETGDEDDEIIGTKRSKASKRMIIDDDEDDIDDRVENGPETEESNENSTSHAQTDSTESNVEGSRVSSSQESKAGGDVNGDVDRESDDEDGDVGPLRLDFKDKDVFDAESSDEDRPTVAGESPSKVAMEDASDVENQESDNDSEGQEEKAGSDNDEGFDEDQMDPELLKQLKKFKGASKSTKEREKYSRKAKPTTDMMLELHSESQKLTRGSRVNLPYYEPEEKTLDDFLARATKKRQEYATLKRANDYQKAQIIHEKLSVTPPKPITTRRSTRRSEAASSQGQGSEGQVMALPDITFTSKEETLQDSGHASQEFACSQPQMLSQASTVVLPSSDSEGIRRDELEFLDCDEDDLPDPSVKAIKPFSDQACTFQDSSVSRYCHRGTEAVEKLGVKDNSVNDEQSLSVETVPSLHKDPSRDLFSSQGVEGQDGKDSHCPARGIDGDLASSPSAESEHLSLVSRISETPLSTSLTQLTSTLTSTTLTQSERTEISQPQQEVVSEATTAAQNIANMSTEVNSINSQQISSQNLENTNCDVAGSEEADTSQDMEPNLESPKDKQKSLLSKWKLQGFSLPPAPKLTGAPRDVICLDDEMESPSVSKDPGLLKLMERMTRHSKKKAPKPGHDVDISIVEKEGTEGQQELTLKKVQYYVQAEEPVVTEKSPGSKLSRLKQQLSVGMRKKREEARQRRIELYNLENEEGYEREGEGEQEEEEEEAEMTDDEENSDEDEDEEELILGDGGADLDDDGEDYNPLLDAEAKDDDEEEEDDAGSEFNENSNDFHLNFEVSDEEDGESDKEGDSDEDDIGMTTIRKKKRPSAVVLSDEEEDTAKEAEPSVKTSEEKRVVDDGNTSCSWANEMTPMSLHLEDSQSQGQTKFRRQSSCSPDLYASASNMEEDGEASSFGLNSNNDSCSQSYYKPHTQMLDADGFLKVTQTQKPPKSRISMLAQNATNEDNFGSSMSIGKIFGGATSQVPAKMKDDDSENMKELIGLCSGKFKPVEEDNEESLPSSQTQLKRTQSFETKGLFEDDGETYDPFNILSDDENAQDFSSFKKKRVLSDSEDEDKENIEADSDDGERFSHAEKFTGFKNKKKGIRREFLDEEAELSGSEYDSDENVDLAEEDDILEEEEGDRDLQGVSESKLRDEVGRLHMKQLQDDDDREIMRFKDRYLQDGDLYTDGKGRRRNFRWRDMDHNSQHDMFNNESDEEHVEEDPEETQWRKDRYERDKFLEESENGGDGEDSKLMKLGQGFLQKKDSFSLPSQEVCASPKQKSASSEQKKFKLPKHKGSFLARSKEALSNIAKMARAAFGGNTKNSRGFVFQSVGEKDKEAKEEGLPIVSTMQAPKRKAHTPSQPEQAAKKQKLASASPADPAKPSIKRKSSILHHLD